MSIFFSWIITAVGAILGLIAAHFLGNAFFPDKGWVVYISGAVSGALLAWNSAGSNLMFLSDANDDES